MLITTELCEMKLMSCEIMRTPPLKLWRHEMCVSTLYSSAMHETGKKGLSTGAYAPPIAVLPQIARNFQNRRVQHAVLTLC
mmetsp:Transcript_27976/g.82269  ORF Transcript_27976/g.82269 Transcript_27976/m.82269 type:complete len:81 (-) Transcript_27976:72-314(-)